jgi:two-component system, OmpR family, alkaline phosphatase synthesis response regulator PhoP
MINLLLLEDEPNLQRTLAERLTADGFMVESTGTIAEAEAHVALQPFDVAVVDLGLPDGDGFSFAESLIKAQPECSLVFLTAMADPQTRIRGLELGAGDFLAKPFHYKELLIRIRNTLKKDFRLGDLPSEIQIGAARVNFERFMIETAGKRNYLTSKECALLKFLLQRRGRVVSRDEILDFVWSREEIATQRTVDNFIMRLRKHLGQDHYIQSVRGVGYVFKDESVL